MDMRSPFFTINAINVHTYIHVSLCPCAGSSMRGSWVKEYEPSIILYKKYSLFFVIGKYFQMYFQKYERITSGNSHPDPFFEGKQSYLFLILSSRAISCI